MAKLLAKFQTFVDTRDGNQYGISKVVLSGDTTDDLFLPITSDAAMLHTGKDVADETFYIWDNSVVSIDGGTAGVERVIVSRHRTMVNFSAGQG